MPKKSTKQGRSEGLTKGRRPLTGGARRHTSGLAVQRQQLAYAAARIMAEEQVSEFEHARRKAAARLGLTDKALWPDNEEIQQRLLEQQRLFGGETYRREHERLLEQVLAAMQLLNAFNPRLVGQALTGAATCEQGFALQVFADSTEEVIWTLIDCHIPWNADQAQFRYAGNQRQEHPILCFVAGKLPVQLIVLPEKARHNPPLDPVTNRPQRGASRKQVEQQLQQTRAAVPMPLDPCR